eukprot:3073846-Rhodomonas_salina.1
MPMPKTLLCPCCPMPISMAYEPMDPAALRPYDRAYGAGGLGRRQGTTLLCTYLRPYALATMRYLPPMPITMAL